MGLESPSFISQLVPTNPEATDQKAQGDDHIRRLKIAVQGSFPDSSRAFYLPKGTTLQTGTVNVAAADENKLIPVSAEAANRTVNLPAFSTIWDGWRVGVVKADHSIGLVTVDGSGSETINGALTQVLSQRYQVAWFQYVSDVSGWIMDRQEKVEIGSIKGFMSTTEPDGWLHLNGQTIGNASSAGTARANADTLALYRMCWDSFSDTVCPVSTGRGASAAADFAANKNLGLPNLAGRALVGLDNLGGISAAGVLTGKTTNGEGFGAEDVALVARNLPDIDLTVTDPGHTHDFTQFDVTNEVVAGGQAKPDNATSTDQTASAVTGISVEIDNTARGGAQTDVAIVQPSFATTWIVKY